MEKRFPKHATAAQAKTYYTDEEWQAAYKFSIVRNPWDRMVSWWAHLTTVSEDGPTDCLSQCGCMINTNTTMVSKRRSKSPAGVLQPTDESSNESFVPSLTDPSIGDPTYYCSFTDFFETCVAKYDFTVGNRGQPLGHVEVSNWWNDASSANPDVTCEAAPFDVGSSYITQLLFTEDNASRIADASELVGAHSLIDFVGRTENLTAHFEEAMVAAGNDRSLAAACAASLLDIDEGSAGHEDYQLYYTTKAQRRRADVMFQTDHTAFDYAFDVEGPFTFNDRYTGGWTL